MNRVKEVGPIGSRRVRLIFADGFIATVELATLLGKGMGKDLLAPDRFAEVSTEPGGDIAWQNGFDVCPEYLRRLAQKQQKVG
jgi:hypothetical protein